MLASVVVSLCGASDALARARAHRVGTRLVQKSPCAGEPLPPRPGGGAWRCTFDDEFDRSTGDASTLNRAWWTPQSSGSSGDASGGAVGNACYIDSPDNVSVSGGALHLTARSDSRWHWCGLLPTHYTSGNVSTIHGFSQTYGRFEVRALIPQAAVPGLQETFWLWPVDSSAYGSTWPDSGEVDFAEFFSRYFDLAIPYIHYNYDGSADPGTNTVTANCRISPTQYNDYAVTWTPGTFVVTINGLPCLVDHYRPSGGLTSPQPFDRPFFVVLTQALGITTNGFGSSTPLPATTSVDYVRVWK